MASREDIEVSKLLLDQSNARLGDEQPTQQATQLALAQLLGTQLLEMARDIVENGLDPTTLMAVTPEGAPPGKFRVIEGNRRLLALRALDTPAIVDPVFSPAGRKKLAKLSSAFRENPIASVPCVVFDREDEARHWIVLRHTGANGGVGLVEWGPDEQDRYKSRHGDLTDRGPAGQVIDFVDRVRPPRPGDNKKIFTTLQRLIATPAVREILGIDISANKVYSFFPGPEVLKGLLTIVEDLRSGAINVTKVYYEHQRINYVRGFSPDKLPDPQTRLPERVLLSSLSVEDATTVAEVPRQRSGSTSFEEATGSSAGGATGSTSTSVGHGGKGGSTSGVSTGLHNGSVDGPSVTQPDDVGSSGGMAPTRRNRVKIPRPRTSTIPKDCVLWIEPPRINAIYYELVRLDVEQFTNACAVSLRVFVELSVDHHIEQNSIMPEEQRRNTPLSKRLKELATHLRKKGVLSEQLYKAVIKITDGKGMFSASTVTFNQYVHNPFTFPTPSELRTAWDELQPFMMKLWTK